MSVELIQYYVTNRCVMNYCFSIGFVHVSFDEELHLNDLHGNSSYAVEYYNN